MYMTTGLHHQLTTSVCLGCPILRHWYWMVLQCLHATYCRCCSLGKKSLFYDPAAL